MTFTVNVIISFPGQMEASLSKFSRVPYYRISEIFRVGLIFAKFATSLKSPKLDTAKNKPYYKSSLKVLEIAKIGLSENLTHLPSVIFAKISRREKFPIYGITNQSDHWHKIIDHTNILNTLDLEARNIHLVLEKNCVGHSDRQSVNFCWSS